VKTDVKTEETPKYFEALLELEMELEEAKDKWKIVDGDCRECSNGLITHHVDAFKEGFALATKQHIIIAEQVKGCAAADRVALSDSPQVNVTALRKELLMAPAKSSFTFTRDEMIYLVGLPEGDGDDVTRWITASWATKGK
jgi:hypothetical protein